MDETKPTGETVGDSENQYDQRQQQIVDMGSTTITTARGTIHTLTIVGQIEGHQLLPSTAKTTKYEHVMPLLAAIEEILQLTEDAFTKRDLSIAVQVEPLEQVVDKLIAKIKDHHIDRLTRGECTIEMGFILSDLLNNCERVSDHCSNIAVALIEVEHNSFDTHKYLNDVKYGSADFAAAFAAFAGKYAL